MTTETPRAATPKNSSDRTPSLSELEDFLVNNSRLNKISGHLRRFNPIMTMGMAHMEIRHSRILGWLLDPQESHGLGDSFLKAFLASAVRGGAGKTPPDLALKLSQADLQNAEVRREWRNIDLLVMSPANRWVFIIENKFHGQQHDDQLTRYFETVTATYGHENKSRVEPHDIYGIFLTLHDEEPEDPRYAPIQYADIVELVRHCVEDQVRPLAREVRVFVKHYIEVIEEMTDMDSDQEDMIKLARKLYRENRKVIDFIIEHGSGNDFSLASDALFGADTEAYETVTVAGQDLAYNQTGSNVVSFLPLSWYKAFGEDEYYWHGCGNWWAEFPVICRIVLDSSEKGDRTIYQLRLIAEVGPLSEHKFRKKLIRAIEAVDDDRIGFRKGATREGTRRSRFFKGNSVDISDPNNPEDLQMGMETLIERFGPVFTKLASPMGKFRKYGKQEDL